MYPEIARPGFIGNHRLAEVRPFVNKTAPPCKEIKYLPLAGLVIQMTTPPPFI
jgi:hypothetical protein